QVFFVELVLQRSKFRLGALKVVDVGEQNVTADDTPVRTSEWKPAHLKPSIDAIKTPYSFQNLVWIARFHRVGDDLDGARQIVGMNGVGRSPLFQLFQRAATVRKNLLVHGFHFAGRRQGGHQAWNAVHDQTRLALAFLKIVVKERVFEGDGRL